MKKSAWINIILFTLLAAMAILAAKGGVEADGVWADVLFGLGVGMIGGIVTGGTLYGIDFLKLAPRQHAAIFKRIAPNRELGESYWIELVEDLDLTEGKLWFVGNRHATWIDRRLAYRSALESKLVDRVARALVSEAEDGWETLIILKDPNAISIWIEFITEVERQTGYAAKRPDLIRVGYARERPIPYSIVAYSQRVVITPYTSSGRSAESPTLDVAASSDVARLYFNDLEAIKASVADGDWWSLEDRKQEERT